MNKSKNTDVKPVTGGTEYFKDRKAAYDWLELEGYKVSIGKFYQDIKKTGFPALNKDKTVSKYQVAVYAKNLEDDNTPDLSAIERSEYAHRKEIAETEMAEMKSERMKREEDTLWLHADDAWSTVAAVIGGLRDSIRRQLHDAQIEIVQTAGGDIVRAPEVFEFLDHEVINKAFNEIAKRGINVNWEDADSAGG